MRLSKDDVAIFFQLIWKLQFYVNRQAQIWPGIHSVEDYASLDMKKKAKVREKLWQEPAWIEKYLDEDPDHLSTSEKDIVCLWQKPISGRFFVLRHLKKHTIFIGEEAGVYGVVGLNDDLPDIFSGRPLPIMVEAVLLPFKGRIIYDGLMKFYDVSFGHGICSDLNEKYMVAKQNGRIITTLDPDGGGEKPNEIGMESPPEWNAAIEEIVKASGKLQKGTALQAAAFAFLRAGIRISEGAVKQGEDINGLWTLTQQAQKALHRLQRVLNRISL
jgi:hypothetical protein